MPSYWLYHFAIKRALHILIVSSAFRLTHRIHLFLMALRLGGRSTKCQTWFDLINSIYASIALIHNFLADDVMVSL